MGRPSCDRASERREVTVGTRGNGNLWGEADPFPLLPPRNATGEWMGSPSTCAAWQPCVAVPLAGTACAQCLLPMLAAVPRRMPHLPGGARPSAVSQLSQPPISSLLLPARRDPRTLKGVGGGASGGPLTLADCWLTFVQRHRRWWRGPQGWAKQQWLCP